LVATHDGGYDLGAASLADTWSVRLGLGPGFVPRVATGHGRDVTVGRSAGGDYTFSITGHPVTLTQGCNGGWSCSTVATSQYAAAFDATITDYAGWDDVAQRNALFGLDYFGNVDQTSSPPEIVGDPATGGQQLLIRIANSHYLTDGTAVVNGHGELRIPNAFLKLAYGVPDPTTMTGASLTAKLSGAAAGSGTVTISPESGADAMRVVLDGVTFSARTVSVRRGTIVPTRPRSLHGRRLSAHRARMAFAPSTPRGAKVMGYRARCARIGGGGTRYANGSRSPIVVTGLAKGRAYSCAVRARSKAGYGPWSATVRVGQRR
jgi:hypothetical protein